MESMVRSLPSPSSSASPEKMACAHHTGGTQVAYQLARVDMADADDVVGFEIVVKAAGGAPVAHIRAGIAHHIAGDPDSWRIPDPPR